MDIRFFNGSYCKELHSLFKFGLGFQFNFIFLIVIGEGLHVVASLSAFSKVVFNLLGEDYKSVEAVAFCITYGQFSKTSGNGSHLD
jgi:hypothetical protein